MKFYKKIIASILAVTIFLPGVIISNNNVFAAGDWDCKIGVSPFIKQYPNWCWVTSGQMMLREYLIKQGKLKDTESIYDKYGSKCIDIINKYTGKSKTKTIAEFDSLFKSFWNAYGISGTKEEFASTFNSEGINKETAFLVYLCSDRLSESGEGLFYAGDTFVDVVLEAADLKDVRCYTTDSFDITKVIYSGENNDKANIESLSDSISWKMGFIYFAINQCDSAVVSRSGGMTGGGHYTVINGINNGNKLYVNDPSDTNELTKNLDYLNDKHNFYFIGKDSIFDDSIEKGNVTSIFCQNSGNLKKDDEVYVALNSTKDKLYLQDSTNNVYYEFYAIKQSRDNQMQLQQPFSIVDRLKTGSSFGDASEDKYLNIYIMVVPSNPDFTNLSDLKNLKFVDSKPSSDYALISHKVGNNVYYNLSGGEFGSYNNEFVDKQDIEGYVKYNHISGCILSEKFNPKKDGYVFKGWLEESTNRLHGPNTSIEDLCDYKLRAVWEPGSGGSSNSGSSNSGGGSSTGDIGDSTNSGSGSSGGGSSSGSSGSANNLNNNSIGDNSQANSSVSSTNFPVLIKYSYHQSDAKPISAEQAISLALNNSKDIPSLTKVDEKNNKAIIFETNKYNEKGEKENLAKWTVELDKLNKEFATSYDEKKVLEAKQSLTAEEQTKLVEINNTISKFNFKLQVTIPTVESATSIPQKAKESLKSKDAIVVDFLENGIFPGQMKVDLKLGKDKANKKYMVYYLLPADEKNSKSIVQLLSKEITVNNEGYVRFVADRGADYIFIPVTDENLASADTFTELLRN